MSEIFLSHSSKDNSTAAEVSTRLQDQGHRSIFLDFDPGQGIPAGRDWERELYEQLRDCRAVLVLCSQDSMSSRWCFAEITHAKALGKHVFPIKIADCEIDPVLTSRQILDLTGDREQAFERLWRGLEAAGLDPANAFVWDGRRPPYPGLLAFEEEDAAIFFGREPEIQRGLETLHRLRRFGGARVVMVLGSSGSGKSSLVRAGLLPRLRRASDWLVIDPFRPREDPLQELAIVLARAFSRQGRERDWKAIRTTLEEAASGDVPAPEALIELTLDLQVAAERREATTLLVIDQAEELLSPTDGRGAARFLPLLRAAMEAPGSPLMALATMRSDFLGDLQQHPSARDLDFEELRVGPLARGRLVEVIEGPARLARVRLEEGLTEAMLEDAETEDALPLLAFTLRELYERYGADKLLALEEYRERLGGLGGAVRRAADAVLAARPLSAEQEADLRTALVSMVRVNEEGQFARRPARWSDLPASVHDVLERFVAARLLMVRGENGTRVLEVAHEALFRSWDKLRGWLDEAREFLLWRKRLAEARREWERTGRDPGALLSGPALAEARKWVGRHEGSLEQEERELIQASADADARRRRTKLLLVSGALLFLFIVAVGGITLWRMAEYERQQAEFERRQAESALEFSFYMSDQLKGLEKPFVLENLGRDLKAFVAGRQDPVAQSVGSRALFFEGLAALERADSSSDLDEAVRALLRFELYRAAVAAAAEDDDSGAWLKEQGYAGQALGDAAQLLFAGSSSASALDSAKRKFDYLRANYEAYRGPLDPYAGYFEEPAGFRTLREESYRTAMDSFQALYGGQGARSEEAVLGLAGLHQRLGDVAAAEGRLADALAAYGESQSLIERHRGLNEGRMREALVDVSRRIYDLVRDQPGTTAPADFRWELAVANDFLQRSEGPDVDRLLEIYDESVDFYGTVYGEIRADKTRYFNRWPEIHYTLIGDVEVRGEGEARTLEFPVRYDTFSRTRGDTKSGTTSYILGVRPVGSGWKIVRERTGRYLRE